MPRIDGDGVDVAARTAAALVLAAAPAALTKAVEAAVRLDATSVQPMAVADTETNARVLTVERGQIGSNQCRAMLPDEAPTTVHASSRASFR